MDRDAHKKKVKVEIFDDEYIIKGSNSELQLKEIAKYVDENMHKIGNMNETLTAKQVAVLAALNIAEDFYSLKKDYQRLLDVFEEGRK